jgi:hypothetical protein
MVSAAAAAAAGRPPSFEDAHGGVHQKVEAGEEVGGVAGGRALAAVPPLVGLGHVEGLVVVLMAVVVVVLQVTCYLRQPGATGSI